MSLVKTIQAEYLAARYAKDTLKANLLSTLLGEAQTIGKDAGNRDATDEETVAVIKKFIKGANEVAESARNNHQAMTNAYKEIEILDSYLPKQLTVDEIRSIIGTLHDLNDHFNMGFIQKHFKDNYPMLYDGKVVAMVANEWLNK